MRWLRAVFKHGRGLGGLLPAKRMLSAAATVTAPGGRAVGTSSVDGLRKTFTLVSHRDACGQDATPSRAMLSHIVAGNYRARRER